MQETILAAGGTRAQRAAASMDYLELARETDTGRAVLGSEVGDNHIALDGSVSLPDLAILASGETALNLRSQAKRHDVRISVTAGGGSYGHNIVVPSAVLGADGTTEDVPFQHGDLLTCRVEMPASANPSISFFDAPSISGDIIYSMPVDAGADKYYLVTFRYSAGAWRLFSSVQSLG